MKDPPVKNYWACVRKPSSGIFLERAWCGAEIKATDFAFLDAGHALRHYNRTKHLQACPDCLAAIRAAYAGGVVS